LFSQEKGFNGGIYFGGVTSQVDGDNHAGYNKIGVEFGIFSQFKFNTEWFGNLEIGYINKGSKFIDTKLMSCYSIIANYIQIPIYASYKPKKIKNITQLSFDFGLSPSILTKAKEDMICLTPTDPYILFKKLDLNILAGINWHFNKHFKIGSRFMYSIFPIRQIKGNPNNDIFERGQYNNAVTLDLFFSI
jgi:hypothetical protein